MEFDLSYIFLLDLNQVYPRPLPLEPPELLPPELLPLELPPLIEEPDLPDDLEDLFTLGLDVDLDLFTLGLVARVLLLR